MRGDLFLAASRGNTQQHFDELTPWLAEMKRAGHNVALLIDAAMADIDPQAWPGAMSLYEGTRWASLGDVAPLLIELSSGDQAVLRRALMLSQGRPMLSLVATTMPIEGLVATWRMQVAVRDPSSDELLLRWADTRCSVYLPDALSAQNWDRLSAPLRAWRVIDRHGQLCSLPLQCAEVRPKITSEQSACIALSQAEFSRLMDFAEPDALLNLVAEQVPELLPENGRSETHTLVANACAMARRYGLTSTPDLVALAIFTLGEGHSALALTDLPRALQTASKQPGSLTQQLEAMA
jgi:hypothetical protein